MYIYLLCQRGGCRTGGSNPQLSCQSYLLVPTYYDCWSVLSFISFFIFIINKDMEPLSSVVLGCHLPVMAATITASNRGYPESNGEPHTAGINWLHVPLRGCL